MWRIIAGLWLGIVVLFLGVTLIMAIFYREVSVFAAVRNIAWVGAMGWASYWLLTTGFRGNRPRPRINCRLCNDTGIRATFDHQRGSIVQVRCEHDERQRV